MTTTTEKSTKEIFTELVDNLRGLARDRVREVKEEREEERENRRHAMVQIGIAAGLTLIGAFLVVETIALGLVALGLAPWLGHGIVAVIALVVGLLLLRRMPDTTQMDTVPESAIKR